MCGLTGVAGNIFQKEAKMHRDMQIFDTVRGFDSTGTLFVGGSGETAIEKVLGAPSNLWENQPDSLLSGKGVPMGRFKALLGHNRAATIGDVTADNAHPFEYGDITGMHNGTLRNWTDLEGYGEFDVDSRALMNHINIHGIDSAWKSFWGAAAITYWDAKDETLNMIRNSERPLFIATNKERDCIFWASRAWMLYAGAEQNQLEMPKNPLGSDEKEKSIHSLALDTLYTYKPTKTGIEFVGKRQLEKKPLPKKTYTGFSSSFFKNGGHFKGGSTAKDTPINDGWSAGTTKGDKSLRGRSCSMVSTYSYAGGTKEAPKNFNCYVFEFEGGELLKVFPRTDKEDEILYAQYCSVLVPVYKLKWRPRVSEQNRELSTEFKSLDLVKLVGINEVKKALSKKPQPAK